jgi:hypothetical protein
MTPTQIGPAQWLFTNIGSTDVNGQNVELHAIAEIVNMEEAVGGQFDNPYTVDLCILPAEKHVAPSVKEDVVDTYGAETGDYEPHMLYGYGYHIPVNSEDPSLGGETNAESDLDFTVEGHNMCFDTADSAEEYITEYIPRFLAEIDISATLSKPVNRARDTGHSVLETICSDE